MKINPLKLNVKEQLILVLVVLGTIGVARHGTGGTIPQILIAVGTAAAIDEAIFYLRKKRLFFPSSAVITGLLIAFVLSPGQKWFAPLIAAAIAIGLKNVLRIDNRPLFNPAAFGLLAIGLLFPVYYTWWGAYPWWLIIIPVGYILHRLKLLWMPASYAVSFLAVSGLYSLVQGQSPLAYVSLINVFFIFIMLSEHRTAPRGTIARVVYSALAGGLSFIILTYFPRYDYSIWSLAAVNLLSRPLEKLNRLKKAV